MSQVQITQTEKPIVESRARDLRRQLSRSFSIRDSLLKWIQLHNGRVTFVGDGSCEKLKVYPNGSFEIFLPINSSEARDNFTLAHELGHLFIHVGWPIEQTKQFGRSQSNRMEWEANWFAAELLMPEAEVRNFALLRGANSRDLARKYGVSQMAAKIRLESLGYKAF